MNQCAKIIFLIFIAACISNLTSAQTFEGEIIYQGKLIPPEGVASKSAIDSANNHIKLLFKLIYKKDRYKMTFSDKDSTSSVFVYNPKDSLVAEKRRSKTLTHDSRQNKAEFSELIYLDEKDTINGIPCEAVRIKSARKSLSSSDDVTYFFNRDYFKIDPRFFVHHEMDFYNHYTNAIASLPLKIRVTIDLMMIEYTMIEYKGRKIKSKEFNLN